MPTPPKRTYRTAEEAEAAMWSALGPGGWITRAAGEAILSPSSAGASLNERMAQLAEALRAAAERIGGLTGRHLENAARYARFRYNIVKNGPRAPGMVIITAETVDGAREARLLELRDHSPARLVDVGTVQYAAQTTRHCRTWITYEEHAWAIVTELHTDTGLSITDATEELRETLARAHPDRVLHVIAHHQPDAKDSTSARYAEQCPTGELRPIELAELVGLLGPLVIETNPALDQT